MRVRSALLAFVIVATPAAQARAQGSSTLTLTNGAITFNTATATDFSNGFSAATGSVRFDVDARGGPAASRTTIVQIRATTASLGGTKPLADFQWRRSDLGTWNSITNANVTVESRAVIKNKQNDTWGNDIFFRMLLNYGTDVPATYGTTVVITLTTTQP